MTKENKFKIGLCLQGIALSMDEITLKANEDRLKMIEKIIIAEPTGDKQEPCEDAISRQYLLDNCVVDKVTMPYVPISKIQEVPSVKPQEPKTGHWIIGEIVGDGFTCSECGTRYEEYPIEYNYCPNCGAKMVEPQERSE